MPDFLALEAYLGGDFLHPGGRTATEALLKRLDLPPGARVLELGCGTGATACLMAREKRVQVVALELSPVMLMAAQARSGSVFLVRADVSRRLPFPTAVFDAVYAESVVALLEPTPVIREAVRVLRPGGQLALIERVWKPGVPQALVEEVNAVSTRVFGIPAATRQPLDRDGWLALLRQAGLVEVQAVAVDTLLAAQRPEVRLRQRLVRARRYLARPQTVWQSLWFKVMVRRYAALWSHLESYLFLAWKAER